MIIVKKKKKKKTNILGNLSYWYYVYQINRTYLWYCYILTPVFVPYHVNESSDKVNKMKKFKTKVKESQTISGNIGIYKKIWFYTKILN